MLTARNISQTQHMQTRLLRKGELSPYLEHLLRLDTKTREQRFDHAICDNALHNHCNELEKYGSRVLGAFIDNQMRGACEISKNFSRNRSPVRELAFSVEQEFQGHHIGSALMKKTLRLIAPATTLVYCQISNLGMLALAEKFGADITLKQDHVVCELRRKQNLQTRIKMQIKQHTQNFEMMNLRDLVSGNPYF